MMWGPDRPRPRWPGDRRRGVSHVVGVALLLGLTVIAIGGLTMAVGGLLEAQAANADAQRVADQFDDALDPVGTTGYHRGTVSFSRGHLKTEPRTLRVLENGAAVERVDVDALVFEAGDRRVAYLTGAVVRGVGGSTWVVEPPAVTTSRDGGTLVVGAPRLGAGHVTAAGTGGRTVALETNVSHERESLGTGDFALAIETATPAALERHFDDRGASTDRRTFPGDDHPSVVADYPGDRTGYLVVHEMDLEVGRG